ncbi:type I polyketide synthase [soil metagenome]
MPTDIDIFGHMNNSRYPQLMDYARLDYLVRMGLLPVALTNRWTTPLGMTQMDFRASLMPFQEFEIGTKAVGFDDRWFYLVHTFRTIEDQPRTVATGYVKLMFRAAGRTVAPKSVVRMVVGDEDIEVPPMTDEARARFLVPGTDGRPPSEVDQTRDREPIAIVGVGCRLPGGLSDLDEFWAALMAGRDCIVDIPGNRWDPQKYLDPTGRARGRSYVHQAGILTEDPKAFDPAFFGIPPREAAILDPQQRLLLECTWEAFEDAGEPPNKHAGANTGVFVGGFMTDHFTIHSDPRIRDRLNTHSATSGTHTMLSNRISYTFDLHGPSVTVDTACSSSLVAIHQACQSIWSGETPAALAGGANVIMSPETHVTMAKGRYLSKVGRCQAFSDTADGYVRGEGAVVMLLKPLSAARRDGNTIHAVILGTASNQDGRTNGISVPNGDAQVAVMEAAYAQAGVKPTEVGYVEAHGTGTPVGDPIEARAIGTVVGSGRHDEPCLVGSVKTNVGHLEAAAGAAGVLKAALCVKHGYAPPHLHLNAVNPAIDLDALNITIPTTAARLERVNGRRVAGVNSFGYGGTNAHIVLAEPPVDTSAVAAPPAPADEPVLLLSARSPEAFGELAGAHADMLAAGDTVVLDHCRSAAVHRSHLRYRKAFPAADRTALVEELRAFGAGSGEAAEPAMDNTKLLFVYTGMGPQWWAMGRQLFETQKVFRDSAEECDAAFQTCSGWSILSEMLADESASRIARTEFAQPANAVLQIALTRLWRSWGVLPDAVLGHSVGELGAAFASNALSLNDTMLVAYHRSRLQARLAGRGSMLAVGLAQVEAAEYAGRFAGQVSVAAVNGPSSVTLAGDAEALGVIAAELTAGGRFNRLLQVEVPYHSPLMEEIRDELAASLESLQPAAPDIAVYSSATGARLSTDRHDATYWWQNVRGTVLFADALNLAMADGNRLFLEIGPHPVLATSIRDVLGAAGTKGVNVASLIRGKDEPDSMRAALRSLFAAGARIDWQTYFGPGRYTELPKYPWRNEVLWEETTRSMQRRMVHPRHPMILDREPGAPELHIAEASFASLPYLEDHNVAGTVLFPGAGYVELALAARDAATQSASCSIEDVEFISAVPLDAEYATRLTVSIAEDSQILSILQSREDGQPVQCARAKVFSSGQAPSRIDVEAIRQRLTEHVAATDLYTSLAKRRLLYGPQFRGVAALRRGQGEVLADLLLPDGVRADGYHLHPVLLDAAFHSLIAAAGEGRSADLLPTGIDRVQYFATSELPAFSHGRINTADDSGIRGDITLFDADGNVIAEVTGFTCRFLATTGHRERLQSMLYSKKWVPLDLAPVQHSHWLTIDGNDDAGGLLDQLTALPEPVSILDLRWVGEQRDSDNPVEDGAAAAERLLETVKALPVGSAARYTIVTCRAESLETDSHVPSIERAVLLGLARTVMSERPDLMVTMVDVDELFTDREELIDLLRQIGPEQEVGFRKGKLFCARIDHLPHSDVEIEHRPQIAVTPGSAFTLDVPSGAGLDAIGFVECDRSAPGDDEVEVEVDYVPMNFKDVLKAMGLLSDRAKQGTRSGSNIGMEVIGRISRVGRDVPGLQPGQRVYVMLPDALRSHAITKWQWAVELPDPSSYDASAGMIATLTAYEGLVKIARLQPGETVLVHGGAGGVGLAAIEIAKWVGAEVIATAGTQEKRDHLLSLGVSRVSGSRDLSFADDVMSWTKGRGVDVVLNFTPGEQMIKSIRCLAPFGRFIEIGKVSFDQDAPLGLRPFNENLLYASLDFDRMMAHKPEYVINLCREVIELFEGGQLGAIPVTAFPAGEVADAFRLMARSRHIGKIAVDLRDPDLTVRERLLPSISPEATYLVTGGLGGFGLETAKWLVAQGARHLALVSRSGPGAASAQEAIKEMEACGAQVRAFAADVGSRDAVAAVLDQIAQTMPELRGIVHSAAVLGDRAIDDLDRAALDRVLAPKAGGAWNLHTLTGDLDFFVLYSSISSLIGNPGQGNYVAANSALDVLGKVRRAQGQPASVIRWGVLGETGLVARDATVAVHLESLGLTPLSVNDALAALGEVIGTDLDDVAVVDADWNRLSSSVVVGGGDRRLRLLAQPTGSAAKLLSARVIELFEEVNEEGRRGHLEEALARIVGAVMQIDEATLEVAQPLHEVGIDSIMGLEIATGIEKTFGLRLSAVELSSGPSIEQLADTLLKRLEALMTGDVPVS